MKKLINLFFLFVFLLSTSFTKGQSGLEVNPYSVKFDGINDYIAVPEHNSLKPTTAISIEAWVYLDGFQYYTSLVEKAARTPNEGYTLQIIYNTIWFTLYHASGQKQIFTTSQLAQNIWNHIAVVYDGTDAFIYVNGGLIKSVNFGTITITNTTDSLYIGQDHTSPTPTFFKGKMDEIKVWSSALSADQIYSRMYREINYEEISGNSFYNSLLAYWKFDETSGPATDSSKNSNIGYLINSPVRDTNAAPISYGKNGLYFDGVNDYVSIGSNNLQLNNTFTFESWIKPKSFGDNEPIIDRKLNIPTAPPITQGYSLSVMSSQKISLKVVFINDASFELQSIGTIDTSRWYHIAATYDGDTVKLYIDGVLDNQVAKVDNILNYFSQVFHIGADNNFPAPQKYFHGTIGEARIWTTALSESDIYDRMFEVIDETDAYWSTLIAYWRIDEGIGNKTFDHSRSENTGVLINGPVWVETDYIVDLYWQGYSFFWNDANNWLPAMVPTRFTNVYIESTSFDPYIFFADGECRNIVVRPNAALTIPQTKTLDVFGNFRIETDTNYTGYLADFGVLNIAGNSIFEREIIHSGWHYISSPVKEASSNIFWGAALYYYDETRVPPQSRWVPVYANDTLRIMKGYDVYYQQTNRLVYFDGDFNSGHYSLNLTAVTDSYNFVGNPYPSTIDWDAPQGWVKTNVDNALYIWDAQTNTVATYINGVGVNGGTRYIVPTQTFFVICNNSAGGVLGVDNRVRTTTALPFRDDGVDNHLKLNLSSAGFSDEVVVRFNEHATSDFDSDYDAYKIFSQDKNVSSLYFKSDQGKLLAINSLDKFSSKLTIPMYLKVGVTGDMNINPDLSYLKPTTDVFLEDLFTGQMHDLKKGSYKFTVNQHADQNRFLLHFIPSEEIALSEEEISIDKEINVWSKTKTIYINVKENQSSVTVIKVFDLFGRKIYQTEEILNSTMEIDLDAFSSAYYVVKVYTENKTHTEKVLIN